mgnify:FL=1
MNTTAAIWVTILVVCGGVAVSLTDVGRVCLFSKMNGVITLNGEPAAGAKLVRTVNLSGDQTDETTADDSGNFEFPAVFKRTMAKHLPQEFAANQDIFVHYDGNEYRMWSAVKRTPDENSESRGKPLVVSCELSSEESMIMVNNSPIFSLCTWDVEPDPTESVF